MRCRHANSSSIRHNACKMKKLTLKRRIWFTIRARKQFKRVNRKHAPVRHVRLWVGEEIVDAISDRKPSEPPKILCLETAPLETAGFLQFLRRRLIAGGSGARSAWTSAPGTAKVPRISSFTDFAGIEFLSTSAALVLAAEYQRASEIVGGKPPVVNLDEWNDYVFQRLFQLGFFPLLGLVDGQVPTPVTNNENVMTLRFWSGSDARETERADEMLMELAAFIDPNRELDDAISIPLTSALSEAMVNVRMHAYPKDYRFQYPHINRWWLTGSADRTNRKLTVAIYDQGASIPVTFEKRMLSQKVIEFLRDVVPGTTDHAFRSDAAQIEAAVRYGNSQSELPERGKGLPQMQEAIDACGNGKLLIFSRGGRYIYSGPGKVTRDWYKSSIGGTLIEWTLELPRGSNGD
jgi:hypothetical protein